MRSSSEHHFDGLSNQITRLQSVPHIVGSKPLAPRGQSRRRVRLENSLHVAPVVEVTTSAVILQSVHSKAIFTRGVRAYSSVILQRTDGHCSFWLRFPLAQLPALTLQARYFRLPCTCMHQKLSLGGSRQAAQAEGVATER